MFIYTYYVQKIYWNTKNISNYKKIKTYQSIHELQKNNDFLFYKCRFIKLLYQQVYSYFWVYKIENQMQQV